MASENYLDLSDFSDEELEELRKVYKDAVLAGTRSTSWSSNGTSVSKKIEVSTELLGRSLRREMAIRGIVPEGRSGLEGKAHMPASYVLPFPK